MRKIMFLVLCVLVFGCAKEDPERKYTAVGTFRLISAEKHERFVSEDLTEIRGATINLYDECSPESMITLKSNGTFEMLDFKLNGIRCESEFKKGRWSNKPVVVSNALGDFKVDNSTRVYEVYSKGVNRTNLTVDRIDVAYGSLMDNPSGRYIYTYIRIE